MPPRVSVFLFCRNRARVIRRSVESVLGQTYCDFEYIVQDGASTDGTLELLRGYDDPRIDLRSEPDSGPAEAFWRALRRCRGEYVCACLSDEELLPDAIAEGVAALEAAPGVVALTRDGYLTDVAGQVLREVRARPFDLVAYMANRFAPQFSAALFRRGAIEAAGLHTRQWDQDCGEFELWCRLALVGPIEYLPSIAVKYAQHDAQLSRDPANVARLAAGRLRVIDLIAAETALFRGRPELLQACRIGTTLTFAHHLASLGARSEAADLYLSVADTPGLLPEVRTETPAGEYVAVGRAQRVEGHDILALQILEIARGLARVDASVPYEIARTHAAADRVDRALAMYELAVALDPGLVDAHWERGVLLEQRGQIDEALEAWRRSDLARDARRHSLYLAATLKSPRSTNESLLEAHREWARHHTAAG